MLRVELRRFRRTENGGPHDQSRFCRALKREVITSITSQTLFSIEYYSPSVARMHDACYTMVACAVFPLAGGGPTIFGDSFQNWHNTLFSFLFFFANGGHFMFVCVMKNS